MNFIKNILVMSILLFFIGCTAWPTLFYVQGKKKTSIYPLPLPATSTSSISAIRISQTIPNEMGTTYAKPGNGGYDLLIIGTDDKEITTGITTWDSDDKPVATVDSNGLVTILTIGDGEVIISATNTAFPDARDTVKFIVNATGVNPTPTPSILGFDGKDFIQINENFNTKTNEEK